VKDHMARLRQEALARQKAREADGPKPKAAPGEDTDKQVADYLGVGEAQVSACCGSICSHCEMFLDKAIALVELGRPHHLFMNPSQERMFAEALSIYRNNREEYEKRKTELMDRMRR